MHRTAILGAIAALAALGAFAIGSVASGATPPTVSLRKTSLGSVLVNSKGHTLYLFMKDKNGKSACSGACAKFWPPLTVHGKPLAGPGIKRTLLGTTKRANGTMQVTYDKHPLYTFVEDKQAGQTTGEGSTNFGAAWYAVSAKGAAIVKAAASSSSSSSSSNSGW